MKPPTINGVRRRAFGTYELADPDRLLVMHPADHDVHRVHDHQRVQKGGAWAMIVRPLPPMERGLHEHLRVGRVFWVDHDGVADDFGFMPDGRYRVVCASPWGEVKLWPYEYSVLPPERLIAHWEAGALAFHPTDMREAQLNTVVFYCRSRGIGLADATVMALGSLSGNVGWFEPPASVAPDLEAVAARLHQWPPAGRRRAAARKARG